MPNRLAGALAAVLLFNVLASAVAHAGTNTVQVYYVPITEDQAMSAFGTIQPNFTSATYVSGYRVHNIISIVPTRPNTVLYYDNWEDGYELDLANPKQTSTQIWGDGNTANGTAPGYPTDLFNADSTVILEQDVPVFTPTVGAARAAGSIYYDGRDKIGSTYTVAVTRGMLPVVDCIATINSVCTAGETNKVATVIAGSPPLAETRLWGTTFTLPVGENTTSDNMFQHVSPFIMAMQDGTVVQLDADANGTNETTITLNQGQSYQVAPATVVNAGATFTANKPIQAHMATGDVGSLYESRWYRLYPVDQWSSSYVSPVSSSASTTSNTYNNVEPDPTHFWVYNPGAAALTVTYQTGTTATGALTTGTFSVPAKSVFRWTGLTDGARRGVRFSTTGNNPFYVIGTVDSNGADAQYVNDIHDWGFTLTPETQLTDSALVGWAPSTYDKTAAGNPVWVTPVAATTVYADYDGNPTTGALTDPNGNKYDVSYALAALQVQQIENPSRNNTGMRVYTTDKTDIAVAWGQDPDTAQVVYPYLDLGYTVPPMPSYSLRKDGALVVDGNTNGVAEPGETIEYALTVSNNGPSIVDGVSIIDTLPAGLSYVPGSTTIDGVAVADNTSPNTVFPLDETGKTLNNIPPRTLTNAGESVVKFRAKVNAVPPSTRSLLNTVQVNSNQGSVTNNITIPVASAVLGNRVWIDENGDGYADAGEPGIANATVHLIDANNNVVATTTTDVAGGYRFVGIAAGTYKVDVDNTTLPAGLVPSTVPANLADNTNHADNSSTFVVAAGAEVLTADFGFNFAPSSDVTGGTGTGAIGNRVWSDADGDGVLDPGEPGLNGVAVTLYSDPDGNGVYDTVVASTTTDQAGFYYFRNVPAGAYQVAVTAPANVTQTGDPDFANTVVPAANRDNRTTTPLLLAPGDVYLNADFGYQPNTGTAASIGDLIWFDADADGVYEPNGNDANSATANDNEIILGGVTVALIRDLDADGVRDAGEPIIATTISNANGIYTFAGVPNGRYLVWVNDTVNTLAERSPSFDKDGISTANISAVTISGGTSDTSHDFGYTAQDQVANQGLIGDLVFIDANANGQRDGNEIGLEGVKVELLREGVVQATTYTNESGRYAFGNLPAAPYQIRVTAPTGYTNNIDPDSGNDNVSSVTLTAGQINLGQDFGYRYPTTTTAPGGTIGNLIWNDLNGDGDVDTGEPGIAGVTVALHWDTNGNGRLDAGEPRVNTTTTDANGAYTFTGLTVDDGGANAQYLIQVTDTNDVLLGYWHSRGTANTNNNSQAEPFAVTLTASAATNNNADFGYYRQPAAIGDFVWNDLDRDGVQDAGEPGIGGVKVTLSVQYANGTTVKVVTTTNSAGQYSFGNLLLDENLDGSGSGEPAFAVTVAVPNGFAASPSDAGGNDTIDSDGSGTAAAPTEGATNATYDFGFAQGATIGDLVWFDVDRDGVQDAGEPGLPNVEVKLLGGSTTVATTVTDADGRYLFAGIAAGTYTIDITNATVPTGLAVTAGTTDPSALFTVVAGGTYQDKDFGYTNGSTTAALIGDYVWSDADNDGVQDLGERGIGGVTLGLKGAGADGILGTSDDTTAATATTAADGSYYFTGVAPGEYIVDVTDMDNRLAGFTLTTGPQSTTDPSVPVTVTAGGSQLNIDWGYRNTALFTLTDRVWFDSDGDGAWEPNGNDNNAATTADNEVGFADVSVNLLDSTNKVIATALTDANGAFTFPGLADGAYTIKLADTSAKLIGYSGTTSFGIVRERALTISGNTANNSFGYNRPGVIGDTVFSDADGDRVQDPGERGLGGVVVQLYRDADGNAVFDSTLDTLVGSTTTNSTGLYLFSGLSTGTYFVSLDGTQAALSSTSLVATTVDQETGTNATGLQLEVALTTAVPSLLSADIGYQNAALRNISGTIWNDLDADGRDDGTNEPQLAGVTIALFDAANNLIATTTTNAGGNYSFPDVGTGTFTVKVTDTAGVLQGYRMTAGLDPYPVSTATTDQTNVDFGFVRAPQTGSIGDYIWMDSDRDGVQDAGENGIANVLLRLVASTNTTKGDADDVVIATTRTDANGRYRFDGVPARTLYFVDADQTTLPNGGAGLATTTGSPDPTAFINLSAGENYTLADVGYAPSTNVALGDRVWYDTDGDGIQDGGEIGIGGVTLTIRQGATVIEAFTTNPDGSWLRTLPAGSYTVTITPPAGYNATPTNGPATRSYTLVSGQDLLYADFGLNGGTTGSIGNLVFFDTNASGAKDGTEAGINGVTLNLIGAGSNGTLGDDDDLVLATTKTDANGAYSFSGVPVGTYHVKVTDLDSVLAGLNLTSGTANTDNNSQAQPYPATVANGALNVTVADFGYTSVQRVSARPATGTLGDLAWHDLNGDGDVDAGEPGIEGITINLYQDANGNNALDPAIDNLLRSTTTDRSGAYEFANLPVGKYLVDVTDVAGVLNGMTRTSGTANTNNNSQADPYAAAITATGTSTLTVVSSTVADFGYKATTGYALGGVVFGDTNNSGGFEAANDYEQGGNGAELRVYRDLDGDGLLDAGEPLLAITTADGNGNYSVADLPNGKYIVVANAAPSRLSGSRQTTQTTTRAVQPVTINNTASPNNNFGFFSPGAPTAVTLSSFTATANGEQIVVAWETGTELDTAGFHVLRSTTGKREDAVRVTKELIASKGDGVRGATYTWNDTDVEFGTTYSYWLEEVETDGSTDKHGPVTVTFVDKAALKSRVFVPMIK